MNNYTITQPNQTIDISENNDVYGVAPGSDNDIINVGTYSTEIVPEAANLTVNVTLSQGQTVFINNFGDVSLPIINVEGVDQYTLNADLAAAPNQGFMISPNIATVGSSTIEYYGNPTWNAIPVPAGQFELRDMSVGPQAASVSGEAYLGPVQGIQSELDASITAQAGGSYTLTTDNLVIVATTPNVFIKSGAGDDALQALSGTNVLDGGAGSNFLDGGSGTDTFFVDDRAAVADLWSTVINAHSGDNITLWGITPGTFTATWADGQGAAGATGLTLHLTAAAQPAVSLTLAGFATADLNAGALTVSYGSTPSLPGLSGSSYMNIHVA
jgi:Ca2+-binding RTX toxin-like protein